jgi:hypothetical protein
MTAKRVVQAASLIITAYFLGRGFCGERVQDVIYAGATADSLHAAGFSPTSTKPAQLPPFLKPSSFPGAKPIFSGSGAWVPAQDIAAGDTLSVHISGVLDPTGKPWIGVWIDGKPVHWSEPPAFNLPAESRSKVAVILDAALVGGSLSPGFGVAWTPIAIAGTETGLQGTVSFSGPGHWQAAAIRTCVRTGPIDAGIGVGRVFGEHSGLYLGVSVGIRVEL